LGFVPGWGFGSRFRFFEVSMLAIKYTDTVGFDEAGALEQVLERGSLFEKSLWELF